MPYDSINGGSNPWDDVAGNICHIGPGKVARHVIGCGLTQETRVQKLAGWDDVAGNICKTLMSQGGYEQNHELAMKYMKASAAQGHVEAIALLEKMNAGAYRGTADAPTV